MSAFEGVSPAVSVAATSIHHMHPDVTSYEALVSDLSLWVLDNEGVAEDLLQIESFGERVWWLMGVGFKIVREHRSEYEKHRSESRRG